MNPQSEQEQHSLTVEAHKAAVQCEMRFYSGGLLLLREGERPVRYPLRKNDRSLALLRLLLGLEDCPGQSELRCGAWVPRDIVVKHVTDPASWDPESAYKKTVARVRLYLASNGISASVECSGDGQIRIVVDEGSVIVTRESE